MKQRMEDTRRDALPVDVDGQMIEAWKSEVAKLYNLLLGELSDKEREKLRLNQKEWDTKVNTESKEKKLENIEKYQLDLIGLALHDIMSVDGDLFGGKTSRGIGRCRIENNLKVCSIDTINPETLKKYIFRRKFEKENEDFKFSTDNLDLEVK